MTVEQIPWEPGRFLVQSRTRPIMHTVDLAYQEEPWMKPRPHCGCEDCHAKDGHICDHILATVNFERERLGLNGDIV